jgi:hypothetical protein
MAVRGVPVKPPPVNVERQQIDLRLPPLAALEHGDGRDDDGRLPHQLHELRELARRLDVRPEVVHLRKARELGEPLGVEVGPRRHHDDATSPALVPHRRRDAERLEGLAHADLVREHDARTFVQHLERTEHGVLLPLDVPGGNAVLLGARPEVEKTAEPLARPRRHARASS